MNTPDNHSDEIERLRNRLDYFRRLEQGWLDGDGQEVTNTAIEVAEEFLVQRPYLLPQGRIYPTPTGGILFEFYSRGWDLSVEFYAGGEVEIHGIDMNDAGSVHFPLRVHKDQDAHNVLGLSDR